MTAVDVDLPVLGSLSPSRAGDFMTCPLLFRFRTIDRLPQAPSAAATRGTLVHAVLERLFDLPAAERTVEGAAALLRPEWERAGRGRARRRRRCSRTRRPVGAGWRRPGPCWTATSRLEDPTRLEPARARGARRGGPARRPAAARHRRPGRRAPRAARCGSWTTRPGGRRGEAFEGKALFQMKFYALVLWRTTGRRADAAAADVPRRPRGPALLPRRGRPAGHRAQAAGAVGGDRAGDAGAATSGRSPSRLCDWCDHQALCPSFGGTPPPFPAVLPGPDASSRPVPRQSLGV